MKAHSRMLVVHACATYAYACMHAGARATEGREGSSEPNQ